MVICIKQRPLPFLVYSLVSCLSSPRRSTTLVPCKHFFAQANEHEPLTLAFIGSSSCPNQSLREHCFAPGLELLIHCTIHSTVLRAKLVRSLGQRSVVEGRGSVAELNNDRRPPQPRPHLSLLNGTHVIKGARKYTVGSGIVDKTERGLIHSCASRSVNLCPRPEPRVCKSIMVQYHSTHDTFTEHKVLAFNHQDLVI